MNEIETNNDFAKSLQIELLEKDKEIERLNNIIDKAIEYINKFDEISAYYECIDEDGYNEYFDEDFKRNMLDIFKGVDKNA